MAVIWFVTTSLSVFLTPTASYECATHTLKSKVGQPTLMVRLPQDSNILQLRIEVFSCDRMSVGYTHRWYTRGYYRIAARPRSIAMEERLHKMVQKTLSKVHLYTYNRMAGTAWVKVILWNTEYEFVCPRRRLGCQIHTAVSFAVALPVVSIKCQQNMWSVSCDKPCNCRSCQRIIGCTYECYPRFGGGYGRPCNKTCKDGYFGIIDGVARCNKKCNCVDNKYCNVTDGTCISSGCKRGFVGPSCQSTCLYGLGTCTFKCHCEGGRRCNPKTGACPLCATRYFGKDCALTCPDGKFLNDSQFAANKDSYWSKAHQDLIKAYCKNNCHCINNKKCTVTTGICKGTGCIAGYSGLTCQDECTIKRYGRGCLGSCVRCQNGCNKITGKCHAGGCIDETRWFGFGCNRICPDGYFGSGTNGEQCKWKCHCHDVRQCAVSNGTCIMHGCAAGWHGESCQKHCPTGKFGRNCQYLCHCQDQSSCDRVTGKCGSFCTTRWHGENCSQTCPVGKYAKSCRNNCTCKNKSRCRVTDGVCMVCHNGFYDPPKCDRKCNCYNDYNCDQVTGACPSGCSARYYGDACQQGCPLMRYMDKNGACTKLCHCRNKFMCNVTNGVCTDGKCSAGYRGEQCDRKCGDGTFGLDCNNSCKCLIVNKCHFRTGKCDGPCRPRYYGPSCTRGCPMSHFMINKKCVGVCHCHDPEDCNVATGDCGGSKCADGWTGPRCALATPKVCVEFYTECIRKFGPNCTKRCHCLRGRECDKRNGYCANGCAFRYTGEGCQTTCPIGYFGSKCDRKCRCKRPAQCCVTDGQCMDGLCVSPRYGNKKCGKCPANDPSCVEEDCVDDGRKYCNLTCPIARYWFAKACRGRCNCDRHSQCEVATGVCVSGGCKPGWKGLTCSEACRSGMYGRNCVKKCSGCLDLDCDHEYGQCRKGCADGFTGSDCRTGSSASVYLEQIGAFVGFFSAFIIIATGLGYIAMFRRKRNVERIVEMFSSRATFIDNKSKTTIRTAPSLIPFSECDTRSPRRSLVSVSQVSRVCVNPSGLRGDDVKQPSGLASHDDKDKQKRRKSRKR